MGCCWFAWVWAVSREPSASCIAMFGVQISWEWFGRISWCSLFPVSFLGCRTPRAIFSYIFLFFGEHRPLIHVASLFWIKGHDIHCSQWDTSMNQVTRISSY